MACKGLKCRNIQTALGLSATGHEPDKLPQALRCHTCSLPRFPCGLQSRVLDLPPVAPGARPVPALPE